MTQRLNRNLRFKGQQWQFVKKLNPTLRKRTGKTWFIRNLGTADLMLARHHRDWLVSELQAFTVRRADEGSLVWPDAGSLTLPQDTSHGVRRGSAKSSQAATASILIAKATGQAIPVLLNVERYLKEAPAAATTQSARRTSIDRFAASLPNPTIEAVTRRVAGAYISSLVDGGLAPKSVNGHVSHLSAYWKWLEKRGIATANPWKGQHLANTVKVKRLAWSLSEIVELIELAPTQILRDAIMIAALSGLRAGELAALKVADCENSIISVRVGKSAAATRKVPIHSQLNSIIEKRTRAKSPIDYLLPELNGSAKSLVKRFARYRAQIHGKSIGQADKTFHSLRHQWIDERLKAGCDLYLVQQLAGHKLQGVTLSHYYHGLSNEQMVAVVEAVSLPL